MSEFVENAINQYKELGYYIANCYFSPRPSDDMDFENDELGTAPRLNGYAIIPLDEYVELTGIEVDEEWSNRIDEFDAELLKLKPIAKDTD